MKDFLRDSKVTIHSRWYSLKNGKKTALQVVAIYGRGARNTFTVSNYEFASLKTGNRFDAARATVLEMLENGELIENYDYE